MQSWWNVYLFYKEAFYFDCAQIIFIVQKIINVMVLFKHATRGFDSSCLG
jgi:hypothetical protein